MHILKNIINRYHYSIILQRQLVKTDFKLRYQGSVLGYVWSLLRPLLIFMVLYLVFTVFLPVGKDVPHYSVYLLLGIVLWNFFSEITAGTVGSIVDKGDLIRKINFPKYNIILSKAFAAVINMFFNFIIIGVFMLLNHIEISWQALLVIPLIMELFLLSLGFAFLLSALFVKFRDVTYIWEVFMQVGFYTTPIIYPLTRIANHRIRELLLLNPLAQIIQDSRYILITHRTTTLNQLYYDKYVIWLIPISVVLIVLIMGSLYFRSNSRFFAEEV